MMWYEMYELDMYHDGEKSGVTTPHAILILFSDFVSAKEPINDNVLADIKSYCDKRGWNDWKESFDVWKAKGLLN